MGTLEAILLTIITASTPLLLAAIGELLAERAGVLNLGVEGMMAVGAVAAFAAARLTGAPEFGIIAAAAAGALLASLFALATLVFAANQVASGLALTIFGLGLAGLLGSSYMGRAGEKLGSISVTGLSDIPLIGSLVFGQDPITYLAVALTIGVWWFLFRSRGGLIVRAVGDNHGSAHALGYRVVRVRFLAVLFGGACAGLAGGYLSLVYIPQWTTNMTAGRGWIAVALVVFASWLPSRVAIGALLFGAVSVLQLHIQALGGIPLPGWFSTLGIELRRVSVPSQFLTTLPYLMTIIVLVVI